MSIDRNENHQVDGNLKFSSRLMGDESINTETLSLQETKSNLIITPDSLMEDNKSPESQERIRNNRETRDNGELIVEETCCDPRPPLAEPEQIVQLTSIAASGPVNPFRRVYEDERVIGIMVKPHYKTFIPGNRPFGCGGVEAKARQISQPNIGVDEGDIEKYIRKYVPHSDAVFNALLRCSRITELSGKPTLATAINSEGDLSILGWFRRNSSGALEVMTKVPMDQMMGRYNASEIYAQGIPCIDRGDVLPEFQDRIEAYEKHAVKLKKLYWDLQEEQEELNPRIIKIGSPIKSLIARYNNTLGNIPGVAFDIGLARPQIDQDTYIYDQESVEAGLNQLHFAISQSVTNHNAPNDPFSSTNTILIEMVSMDQALDMAIALEKKPWMQEWMRFQNHKIIVSQVRAGQTEKIQYLT